MNSRSVNLYAAIADKKERDPIQGGDSSTRATVPMGRGFALWRRFNPDQELVWIDDAEGHPRAITPKQRDVLGLVLEMIEGPGMTMTEMAQRLGVSVSTVSRAMTKFQAWGIIRYMVGRGRYAGLVIFRALKNDGREYLRKAAKARVQRWSEAAKRRLSRSWLNLASYFNEEVGRGSGSLYRDQYLVITMDATLKREWTPQELRDAGII